MRRWVHCDLQAKDVREATLDSLLEIIDELARKDAELARKDAEVVLYKVGRLE